MTQLVTNGICILVETHYRPEYSRPSNFHFLFSYRITIENQTGQYVQLLRRHWNIFDSIGQHSKVDGAGVIGEQPVLAPDDKYTYESACNLTSDWGKMNGFYEFENKLDGSIFEVSIPEFTLIAPFKLN
jgi:ApaG protein